LLAVSRNSRTSTVRVGNVSEVPVMLSASVLAEGRGRVALGGGRSTAQAGPLTSGGSVLALGAAADNDDDTTAGVGDNVLAVRLVRPGRTPRSAGHWIKLRKGDTVDVEMVFTPEGSYLYDRRVALAVRARGDPRAGDELTRHVLLVTATGALPRIPPPSLPPFGTLFAQRTFRSTLAFRNIGNCGSEFALSMAGGQAQGISPFAFEGGARSVGRGLLDLAAPKMRVFLLCFFCFFFKKKKKKKK
jgi:hypothetical protein